MQTLAAALRDPDPALRFRPVQLNDAEALHAVCWPERPLSSVYQLVSRAQNIARQGRGLGVVMVNADRLPFAYGQVTLWAQCAEISDLVVQEQKRGLGYGTGMIQYLMRAARQMQAPAVEIGAALSNPRALALYRRLGFEDSHVAQIDLGSGKEPVLFLRLDFA